MGRPLDGYPTSFGNMRVSVFGHAGPASYTQITAVAGTVPVVGGDIVQAVEAGLKYLDFANMMDESDDACFAVEAIPVTVSNQAGLGGIPATTMRLRWIARVTALIGGQNQTAGNEAVAGTNLSAEIVRIFALGPK